MQQKFNTNTIVSKFIKALLANTYIPLIPIWKPGRNLIKGSKYIAQGYIIEAKQSYDSSTDFNEVTGNWNLNSIYNSTYFNILEPFIEDKFYRNITTNYISNTSIYDSNTHKYLGEYLRMVRDLHNLDLMPYYNCWDGSFSDKLRIKNIVVTANQSTAEVVNTNTVNDGYKTLIIPIKCNQDYTIYINSNSPVYIASIFYNDDIILSPNVYGVNRINYSTYNKPFLYNIKINENNIGKDVYYKNHLKLLIQVPLNNISKVVVLEGNYIDTTLLINNGFNELPKMYFGKNIDELSDYDVSKYFKTYSSLLRNVTDDVFAFSNRLIEYLLLNVIDLNDNITDNIKRIQEYASSYTCKNLNKQWYTIPYIKGVWTDNLRQFLYTLVTTLTTNNVTIDISGYVDKDTATIIERGQNI